MIADRYIVAIDFDGTIVEQQVPPSIGVLFEDAKAAINKLYDSGNYVIIIWSVRVNKDEEDMIKFLDDNGIKYHYVNRNCDEFLKLLDEKNGGFEVPRKIYYDAAIDDRNVEVVPAPKGCSPIDWDRVQNLLEIKRINENRDRN